MKSNRNMNSDKKKSYLPFNSTFGWLMVESSKATTFLIIDIELKENKLTFFFLEKKMIQFKWETSIVFLYSIFPMVPMLFYPDSDKYWLPNETKSGAIKKHYWIDKNIAWNCHYKCTCYKKIKTRLVRLIEKHSKSFIY